MRCESCHRSIKNDSEILICQKCESRLKSSLLDLIQLHKEAHYCLQPQKSSDGISGGKKSSGINLNALDFISGNRIFNILHEWEKLIRHERKLTLPAFVPIYGSIEDEVKATVQFHITHLEWSAKQPWINDYVLEINELRAFGMRAARRSLEPIKRIPCPVDLPDGSSCNGFVAIQGNDISETVKCNKCQTNWSAARLIAVAMSDQKLEIWLDAEAVGHWVNLGKRQVLRIVANHDVPKKGALIELQSFIRARGK